MLPRNPKLVLEGYYGFNIIHLRRRFYAVLQGEGAFDVDRIGTSHYSRSFAGQTLLEVQEAIHASLDADASPSKIRADS